MALEKIFKVGLRIIQSPWLWAAGVFGVLLYVYNRTLLPSIVGGDAGEQQYAGYLLALTHPTGTPLYILVAHLWTHVWTVGSVAYRINMLAAISGALGCAMIALSLVYVYKRGVVALATGLMCGLGATYWGQAVIADKYAFNTIWVGAVAGLALIWAYEREKPYADRLLYLMSFIYGISLLHHRTMVLFAFGFLWLMVYTERWALWRNKKRSLICLALVILPPLIIYPLFLPWVQSHNLAPSEWQPQTVGEWIEWLMDRQEAKEAFVTTGLDAQLDYYADTVLNDYTLAIVILAVIGLVAWLRYKPSIGVFFLIVFLLQGALSANWRDNDTRFTYFLPSFMLILFAAGHGLNVLWDIGRDGLKRIQPKMPSLRYVMPLLGTIVVIPLLGLPVYQYNHTYDLRYIESIAGYSLVGEQTKAGVSTGKWRTTLKAGDMGDRLASGMDLLPQSAVLLSDWEQVTIFWYYQKVENRRTDIEIVYPVEKITWYGDDPRDLCISRTVNVAELTGLSMEHWHPSSFDALTCLFREAQYELPSRLIPIGRSWTTSANEPQLELVGYWMDGTRHSQGKFVPLVLTWRALADLDENYAISLQLRDPQDWTRLIAQWDTLYPVTGMYPTSYWQTGEVVQDYHEIELPLEMKTGTYIWGVVVYRVLPDGRTENLKSQNDEFIFGGTLEVVKRD